MEKASAFPSPQPVLREDLSNEKTGHFYVAENRTFLRGLDICSIFVLQQRDNVLFVPRKSVLFLKNRLRLSLQIYWEENFNERGHYYDEQRRG